MKGRRQLSAGLVMLAIAAAGACGGDGGEGAAPAPAGDLAALVPMADGVGAESSAQQALMALGLPAPVDPNAAAQAVPGVGDGHEPFSAAPGDGDGETGTGATAGGGSGARSGGGTAAVTPPLTVPSIPTVPDTPAIPSVPTVPVAPPAPPPTAPPAATPPGAPAADPTTPVPGGTSGWTPLPTQIVPPRDTIVGRAALRAEIQFDSEVISVTRGDAVPPASQRFEVIEITPTTVVLRLSAGLLPDGGDLLALTLGERVELIDATSGRPRSITLVGIAAG